MANSNKTVLETANEAIRAGDIEAFLASCTDDISWTTVGEQTLRGKAEVRRWMQKAYAQPPRFTVAELIADDDRVAALGTIEADDGQGRTASHAYCDVWRFRDGKMAELQAFVVAPKGG